MGLTGISLVALLIALAIVVYGLVRTRGGRPFRPLFILLAVALAALLVVLALRAR